MKHTRRHSGNAKQKAHKGHQDAASRRHAPVSSSKRKATSTSALRRAAVHGDEHHAHPTAKVVTSGHPHLARKTHRKTS
jgi:hypothetical protein